MTEESIIKIADIAVTGGIIVIGETVEIEEVINTTEIGIMTRIDTMIEDTIVIGEETAIEGEIVTATILIILAIVKEATKFFKKAMNVQR